MKSPSSDVLSPKSKRGITHFTDILSWQKGKSLYVLMHEVFKDCKDFSFRDQLLRASLSVSNNIAEGYGRKTDGDFVRFLNIARGSVYEVESLLLIAHEIGYINQENMNKGMVLAEDINRLIVAFINSIRSPRRTAD